MTNNKLSASLCFTNEPVVTLSGSKYLNSQAMLRVIQIKTHCKTRISKQDMKQKFCHCLVTNDDR